MEDSEGCVVGLSEEAPLGVMVAEKLIGVLLIIVGALATYVMCTNPPTIEFGRIAPYSGIFLVGSLVLLALGICMVLARTVK